MYWDSGGKSAPEVHCNDWGWRSERYIEIAMFGRPREPYIEALRRTFEAPRTSGCRCVCVEVSVFLSVVGAVVVHCLANATEANKSNGKGRVCGKWRLFLTVI